MRELELSENVRIGRAKIYRQCVYKAELQGFQHCLKCLSSCSASKYVIIRMFNLKQHI